MRPKFTLLIICILVCSRLCSQTVDFTYQTASGFFCAPQYVLFTENCSGNPVSFIWNFGNGQSSSDSAVPIIFTNPGNYTVSLTAVYGNDAFTVTKVITINPSPTVSITADRSYLCQPGTVNFTATGSPSIVSYEWDFGDGTPLQTTGSSTIAHNYTAYNDYVASVKVVTAFGCGAVANYSVIVKRFGIAASVAPVKGCIPATATFNSNCNLPQGDAIQGYLWDFGDGSPPASGSTSSTTHLYNTTTPITTASVTITSVQGCANTFDFPDFGFGTPPFNTDGHTQTLRDTFCGSENILFYGYASNANSYLWDFGDNSAATVLDTLVSHKYYSLGRKRVIVIPYFNGCPGPPDTFNIVIQGVIASYLFNNTCSNKNTFRYNSTSLGNVSHFEWKFTDVPGFIDSVNYAAVHTYPPNGSYSADLLLVDYITGCRDSLQTFVYTATPVLNRSTSSVCRDSLITYRVTNTYDPNGSFTYEFHVNGTTVNTSYDSVLVHYPATHGNFNDYVVVMDGKNNTCDDTLRLTPTQVKGPVTDFNVTTGVCANVGVAVTNNSHPFFSGELINKWDWDFGDNIHSPLQNPPPHLYTAGGTYTVKLIATDINGCGSTFSRSTIMSPLPEISAFPAKDTICYRDTAVLRAYTIDTLLWRPATNISCTTCDTTKVYPAATTLYIAQAKNTYGCITADTVLIKVYGPINLQVLPNDTSVCSGRPVHFNLNTDGVTLWSPPTWLDKTTIKTPVSTPDSSISYTVIVHDSVGCYADTAIANIHIYPPPVVNAGPDQIIPYGNSFTISPAYGPGISSYAWTPAGDLTCTNCSVAAGTAINSQVYSIEVTSNTGCKASDQAAIIVSCIESNLHIPSAFTPNRDGLNDYFYPIAKGYRLIKKFVVYDRLGAKVFERTDFIPNIASLGWDGSIRGQTQVSTQSFVWYLEAECEAGEIITSKGSVLLLK